MAGGSAGGDGRLFMSFGGRKLMKRMTKAAVAALILLSASGCTLTERAAAVGAGTGAIIGGATTGTVQGAAVGAAIGGVAGALIGRAATPGDCYYRGRNGRRYVDRC
jgi:hypothetical protein